MHSGIREGELPLLLLQQMKLFIKVLLGCKIAKSCKVTKTAAKTLMHISGETTFLGCQFSQFIKDHNPLHRSFSLNFLPAGWVSGLLLKIEIFAFYRLLNIFVRCGRTSRRNLRKISSMPT